MKNKIGAVFSLAVLFANAQEKKDSIKDKNIQEVVITGKYYQKYKLNEISGSLRLQTPIIELAQNVQTIGSQVLDDQMSLNMSEGVVRNVSGARKVEHWDNVYSNVFMRGASIGTFINGMNVSTTWGPINPDASVIERIEFVKGPADFLGAMGDPAGIYNIVTKKPTGKFNNSVKFTTGSFNLFRGEADLDGVLVKNGVLDYRLNVMSSTSDSWVKNDINRKTIIAPSITFRPTKTTTFTAQYNYQFLKFSQAGAYLFSKTGYETLPVDFNFNDPNFKKTEVNDQSLFLSLDQKLAKDWVWSSQYAYMYTNYDGAGLWGNFDPNNANIFMRSLSNWQAKGKNNVFQTYIRGLLKTGEINHKIIAGFDYGHRTYKADFSYFGTQIPIDVTNPVYGVDPSQLPPASFYSLNENAFNFDTEGVDYRSFYAQDQVDLFNNKLRITLSGRYTNGKTFAGYPAYSVGGVVPVNSAGEFTPRASVSYSINPNFAVYGVFDKTFTPQSGTGIGGSTITDPLKGQNLEFGVKKDWFNGKWNSTVAVYDIRRKNILTPGDKSLNNGINYSITTGEQRARGVEVDVKGEIVKGLNAVINYAYTDATTIKDNNTPTLVGQETPGNAKTVQNTWLTYRFYTNNFLNGFGISAGYQYQGGRVAWFPSQSGDYSNKLPDYVDTNLGINYNTKKYSINLILNNVFDKKNYGGYTFGDYYKAGTPEYVWSYNAPRNWRLSVAYHF